MIHYSANFAFLNELFLLLSQKLDYAIACRGAGTGGAGGAIAPPIFASLV